MKVARFPKGWTYFSLLFSLHSDIVVRPTGAIQMLQLRRQGGPVVVLDAGSVFYECRRQHDGDCARKATPQVVSKLQARGRILMIGGKLTQQWQLLPPERRVQLKGGTSDDRGLPSGVQDDCGQQLPAQLIDPEPGFKPAGTLGRRIPSPA